MTPETEHPSLLLWYVATELDGPGRESIDAHLEICQDCRDEVRALSSMMKSLVAQAQIDHVPSEDLVAYEECSDSVDPGKVVAIRKHLDDCASCRDDLSALGRARWRESAAEKGLAPVRPPLRHRIARPLARASDKATSAPARRSGGRATGLLAAAAVLVALVSISLTAMRQSSTAPGPLEVRAVVFAAPSRGAPVERLLEGPGPWAVRVILPLDAPDGAWRVSIRKSGGAEVAGLETTAISDADGCLEIMLAGLPAAGRYELQLGAPGAPAGHPDETAPLIYPFEHRPAAAPRTAG